MNTLNIIRNHISDARTDLALRLLKNYLLGNDANKDKLNFVIIQEANYNSLKKEQMLGGDLNQSNIGFSKINANILNLIDELDVPNKEKIKENIVQSPILSQKRQKTTVMALFLFSAILFSGFTNFSFFRLFSRHISTEKTQSDLLGRTVYFKNDSS